MLSHFHPLGKNLWTMGKTLQFTGNFSPQQGEMPLFHRCITGCINEFFTLFCGIMYPAEPNCLFPQNIAKSSPFRRPEQEPHARGQKGAKFFVHFPQNTIWLCNLGPLSEGAGFCKAKVWGSVITAKDTPSVSLFG